MAARSLVRAQRTLWLLLMLIMGLIAGCGFHLRGSVELPQVLQRTFIQGSDVQSPLTQEVTAALEDAGGHVVHRLDEATAILQLGGERVDRQVASVDSAGKVREYRLQYSLTFTLLNPAGKVLLPAQTVGTSRIYNFDQSNVLGVSTEEDILVGEMRSFAVRQMLRQISIAVSHGIQPEPPSHAGTVNPAR